MRLSACTPSASEAKCGAATLERLFPLSSSRQHFLIFWGAPHKHCGVWIQTKSELFGLFPYQLLIIYWKQNYIKSALRWIKLGSPIGKTDGLCWLGRRRAGVQQSVTLRAYFYSLLSTEFGFSSLKQCLWSCHTLLCQSDSSTFGLGPSKWWTVTVFPLNAHLMPVRGALHLHIIYMLGLCNLGWKFGIALAQEPCFHLNKMSPLYPECRPARVFLNYLQSDISWITWQFLMKTKLRFQRRKNKLH